MNERELAEMYMNMRYEEIEEEDGDFFCEAEAELIISLEIEEGLHRNTINAEGEI